MAEALPSLVESSFKAALLDAGMTAPGGTTPLFDPSVVDIRLGGDSSINNADNTALNLPMGKIVITIDPAFPEDSLAMGFDDQNNPVTLQHVRVTFKTWTENAGDQDDIQARLLFARQNRSNIFSKYGLLMQSHKSGNFNNSFGTTGLFRRTHMWNFQTTQTTTV